MPDKPLHQVVIKAVYFVPKDRVVEIDTNVTQLLSGALQKSVDFYSLQLSKNIAFLVQVYPKPIIGKQSHLFYDSLDTSNGNPHALLSIRQEILEIFKAPGNVANSEFFRVDKDSFTGLFILHQGVGASATVLVPAGSAAGTDTIVLSGGDMPAALVAYGFLTKPSYKDYGVTIFTHEFGHLLGLQDHYDTKTGKAFEDDIMGSGRIRPLEFNYLSRSAKKLLGVSE